MIQLIAAKPAEPGEDLTSALIEVADPDTLPHRWSPSSPTDTDTCQLS